MIRKSLGYFCLCGYLFLPPDISTAKTSDTITAEHIPSDSALIFSLRRDIPEMQTIINTFASGNRESAIRQLTAYFKAASRKRYYFDWQSFPELFQEYQSLYPHAYNQHRAQADYQMRHFGPETQWQLPAIDLTGKPVSAYELRHLARQYRAVDMALIFHYHSQELSYLNYFVRQVADLNRAFMAGQYDNAGNAIYESFRGGLRVQNWLLAHHIYLVSPQYTWQNQYLLIKTLIHHGAQLQKRTRRFSPGNHHTKGLVALFEIALLFSEFTCAEQWAQQAVDGLVNHLNTEINPDGFQFERSIHYHKGDIENYFRVYQIAALNQYPLPPVFTEKLKQMFDALVCLAQPNRRLPVLQDDTDQPLAEENRMDDIMLIGALLFQSPVYKYFAGDKITPDRFWLFSSSQRHMAQQLESVAPVLGSIALPQTGYYVMRNGWQLDACQMVISAGLSATKPDHQHADMLGVAAYANGRVVLPNYQVNYNRPDFPALKNSWVKNVALVDSIPQATRWEPNTGGSGFGKWLDLPHTKVLVWQTTSQFDRFIGTHDKYQENGVNYYREVIFLKDGFWLIRDHFQSLELHQYQQVWQGDFHPLDEYTLQRTCDDGSALVIRQLSKGKYAFHRGSIAAKPHMVVSIAQNGDFTFNTLLLPINAQNKDRLSTNNWHLSLNPSQPIVTQSWSSDAAICLYKHDCALLCDGHRLSLGKVHIESEHPFSIILTKDGQQWKMVLLGYNNCTFTVKGQIELSGQPLKTAADSTLILSPNETYEIVL